MNGMTKPLSLYPVQLIDLGAWRLTTALVEYPDGMWNCESSKTIEDYTPVNITCTSDFVLNVVGQHPFQWQRHLELPFCSQHDMSIQTGRYVGFLSLIRFSFIKQ